MRLVPGFVFEVAAVLFECRQQRHHLTEYLLVRLRQLCEPSLEERVVACLHEMHSSTYVAKCMGRAGC
jgi:hypothetical protein